MTACVPAVMPLSQSVWHCALLLVVLLLLGALRIVDGSERNGWIDLSTSITTKVNVKDGRLMKLTASDEFSTNGRSFQPGHDAMFEATTMPDITNDSLQFYNGSTDYVTTEDGCLVIRTKAVKTHYPIRNDHSNAWFNSFKEDYVMLSKNYTSGMVMSWNKFCFTGGILEMSLSLPGRGDASGLWPAAWLLGNLGRAGYQESNVNIWPWSYSKCGDIPNLELKQEINACSAKQEEFGMKPFVGRGAPEIDIFEAMGTHSMPGYSAPRPAFMSNSLHVSPGISQQVSNRPPEKYREDDDDPHPWYEGLVVGENGTLNHYYWGIPSGKLMENVSDVRHRYIQDSVSVDTELPQDAFGEQHVYKIEWQPGEKGYLYWYFDDQLLFGIEGSSLSNATGALIPVEPMYMLLNVALSHNWGMPEPCQPDTCGVCWKCFDCTNPECQCTLPEGLQGCKSLPAEMKIDYVRIYQDPTDPLHTLGCSPPEYPTKAFIEAHSERYADWKAYDPQPHSPPPKWDDWTAVGNAMMLFLRIIIALMMIATVVVLLLVLWRGVGDDILQWWTRLRQGYAHIPDKNECLELTP